MTAELLRERRKVNAFTDEEIYSFYVENCKGNCISLLQFMQIINYPLHKHGELLMFNREVAYRKMFQYYNEKFRI